MGGLDLACRALRDGQSGVGTAAFVGMIAAGLIGTFLTAMLYVAFQGTRERVLALFRRRRTA
jgi:hypothetical protein